MSDIPIYLDKRLPSIAEEGLKVANIAVTKIRADAARLIWEIAGSAASQYAAHRAIFVLSEKAFGGAVKSRARGHRKQVPPVHAASPQVLRRGRWWQRVADAAIAAPRSTLRQRVGNQPEGRTPTHDHAPTRDAAMSAFAKSWRRES